MTFLFRNKAETLDALRSQLKSAVILPAMHFSVAEWRAQRERLLFMAAGMTWAGDPLIVRSSAADEDGAAHSAAGRYSSKLGIALSDLAQAVEEVIASYGPPESRRPDLDRVLIQPMSVDIACSGVAFTRDPAGGGHYLIVDGADGADTTAVTGGGDSQWSLCHWIDGPPPNDERMKALLALTRELTDLCGCDALDVEFAFTGEGTLHLYQVRPLPAVPVIDGVSHAQALRAVLHKAAKAMRPHPFLHGNRTILGNMTDWNPAEMIGVRPSPLALSLYRELITDSIWAYQRHNYGYKNLRSFPLLISLHGQPYIDVRVSFNSFLPRDLPSALAEKLVDHYLERLLVKPSLHDKIEFEIVLSAYTFDMQERLGRLSESGFTAQECDDLAASLRYLTNKIINRRTGLWQNDLQKLPILEDRRQRILNSDLDRAEKIYWLIEDCKRYGTLPFAGLARAGFIAVQMLRSLTAAGVFTQADMDAFLGGLSTIGGELSQDAVSLNRSAFLEKYGHLRPGTYDIRSPRYDSAPELYGIGKAEPTAPTERQPFRLSLPQMREIESLLAQHDLQTDVVGLFDFLQSAIEGREKAKFIFTRNVSDVLELLAELGAEHGWSRDDMAYADIGSIREMQASSSAASEVLAAAIARGKADHQITRTLCLPSLISAPGDVWSFQMLDSEPNFITLNAATARVSSCESGDLSGKIVHIPSADPGFDWIFGCGIAGLITQFGGANSHMAIRAAELGLPAVIGAGELNYRRWSSAGILAMDCLNKTVRILQ